jgi:hypothetical protein
VDESLALLLLPDRLEHLSFEPHARDLLTIPRVIALEPGRANAPRLMRDGIAERQAARIRLPGTLRMVVIYHPAQYPLARALCAAYHDAELWYFAPVLLGETGDADADLTELDAAARDRGTTIIDAADGDLDGHGLRERLLEIGVINSRAFVPSVRFGRTRRRWRKADKTS